MNRNTYDQTGFIKTRLAAYNIRGLLHVFGFSKNIPSPCAVLFYQNMKVLWVHCIYNLWLWFCFCFFISENSINNWSKCIHFFKERYILFSWYCFHIQLHTDTFGWWTGTQHTHCHSDSSQAAHSSSQLKSKVWTHFGFTTKIDKLTCICSVTEKQRFVVM